MKLSNDELLHKLQDEMDAWEDVPDEDLWQDGELHYPEIMHYIYHQVIKQGTWKLIRKKGD